MAASASIWFDAQEIAANWTATSTFLCLAIALLLIYPLVTYSEPDTHPFFLAHQSTASPVRQPGESAVYRSNELLPDSPLRSGGPDVDLTSIWTRVAETQSARILTVYGRQKVVDHNIGAITKEINIIGQHIQQLGSARVAVYLPNCIELLSTLFGMLGGLSAKDG